MRSSGTTLLAMSLMLALAPVAQARASGPPDSFDIDVLTAYRYGLNHDWAPASCFGRRYCPEDNRPRTTHLERSSPPDVQF